MNFGGKGSTVTLPTSEVTVTNDEYGFKYLNLHSIRLELIAINERAHRCYLKCGFKDTGCNREGILTVKKPEDIEKCIGIPVLGTIYEYETNNKNNKKKSKKKVA